MFKKTNLNCKRTGVMEKEFVPYEIALSLKKIGFNEPCLKYIWNDKKHSQYMHNAVENKTYHFQGHFTESKNIFTVSVPTFSQVFRWFREEYNIDFTIITNYAKVDSKMIKSYRVGIITVKNNMIDSCFLRPENDKLKFIEFNTHEEAELECLKKLIEIVKK